MDLRLANILQGMSSPLPNPVQNIPPLNNAPAPSDDPQQELMNRLAELANPVHTAQNQLNTVVGQQPNRVDFQPDKTRKVLAAIAGMGTGGAAAYDNGAALGFRSNIPGAQQVTSSILDKPFNDATTDWQNKLAPLEKLASTENTSNVNNRILQRDAATERINQQRADATTAAEKEKERKNLVDEEEKKRRNNAYIFHQTHGNYEGKVDKDGMLVYINKNDPTDIVKTEVDTGKVPLSDIDKINLGITGKLAVVAAQGAEARKTVDERANEKPDKWVVQDNYDPDTGKWIGKVRINVDTGETAPVTGAKGAAKPIPGVKPPAAQSETQKKQGQINKANQIVSEHPELKDYIIFEHSKSGVPEGVHVRPPGWFDTPLGYKESERMRAYNLLFGGQAPVVNNDKGVIPPPEADKIIVEKDGKRFKLPKTQLQEAIKQGYKQVGG